MEAVIIAGGEGTRLGKLTKKIPKSMIKIGGIPILAHQINLLKQYGITDIILLTGYLSEVIEDYFKDGSTFGVRITYLKEEKPLGTTGGIKEVEDKLTGDFIVFYGDIMVNMNLKKLIGFHKSKNSACTLVLQPSDHPRDSDLVEIDGHQKIIAFHSKPHNGKRYSKSFNNAAVYVISPKVLRYIKKGVKADFGRDLFPQLVKREDLYGYTTTEYLQDVGTFDRLEKVNQDYSGGKVG